MVLVMEFCCPKLGRIKDQLYELVTLGGEKVILLVYWPLTQWLAQEVSHSFFILSKSESMSESMSETMSG